MGGTLFTALSSGAWIWWTDKTVRAQFEGRRWALPGHVYARPLDLYRGRILYRDDLVAELDALGYRKVSKISGAGQYVTEAGQLTLATRGFRFADSTEPARRVVLEFEGPRLAALQVIGGDAVPLMRLEPVEVGKIFPVHNEDRVIVRLKDVPPMLVQVLLAVEDRNFYQHRGINPLAIARALVANLRAGRIAQGGSTITQQLAKNFYLTRERSLTRKLNEFLMAVLLEAHYAKEDILEAYLNEIFLGQDGPHSIHGFGLAAQFYFGVPLAELQTHQIALLAGLARGASFYDPRRHPERALRRRNTVLGVMVDQGLLNAQEGERLRMLPLQVLARPRSGASRFPAFMDLVRRQLVRDYQDEDLRSEGLQIFTTLDPIVQFKAEQALSASLRKLEQQRHLPSDTLEGAVVVTGSDNGEIKALVGSRDPLFSGFNRVLDARRQIGSLVKPAVYLTALMQPDKYSVVTRISDTPIQLRDKGGHLWEPENYNHRSNGEVPLHTALAQSYNQATVRLGMSLGLGKVRATLKSLGVDVPIPEYPSLLLGTLDMSPLQVTQMYQTFADGGFVMPLRAIRGVMDQEGKPLNYYGLSVRQAYKPPQGFLMHHVLSEVIAHGTASSAREALHDKLPLAGKTGTTNEMRDSWFAGYGSNLLGVVWIGRDDNQPAGFTGATGALRVWTEMMRGLTVNAIDSSAPAGVEWQWVTDTGLRTDPECPGAERRPFVSPYLPEGFAMCERPDVEPSPAMPEESVQ